MLLFFRANHFGGYPMVDPPGGSPSAARLARSAGRRPPELRVNAGNLSGIRLSRLESGREAVFFFT